MKKQIIFLILIISLLATFVACSSSTTKIVTNTTTENPNITNTEETEGEYYTEIATLPSSDITTTTESNETEIITVPTENSTVKPDEEVTYEIIEEPTLPLSINEPIELPFIPVE